MLGKGVVGVFFEVLLRKGGVGLFFEVLLRKGVVGEGRCWGRELLGCFLKYS